MGASERHRAALRPRGRSTPSAVLAGGRRRGDSGADTGTSCAGDGMRRRWAGGGGAGCWDTEGGGWAAESGRGDGPTGYARGGCARGLERGGLASGSSRGGGGAAASDGGARGGGRTLGPSPAMAALSLREDFGLVGTRGESWSGAIAARVAEQGRIWVGDAVRRGCVRGLLGAIAPGSAVLGGSDAEFAALDILSAT
jgi:hypothetical protein